MSIAALIVDDESLARDRIRNLLARDSEITLVGECSNGRQAIAAIQKERPDLVFLDVQMPEIDGFSVLKSVGMDLIPAVVFVTAHDRYAIKAFEVHALDYLLKPFDRDRFQKSLQRAKAQIRAMRQPDVAGEGPSAGAPGANLSQRLLALLEDLSTPAKHLDRLVVKSGGRVYFLKTSELDWMEAAGNYVRLHVGREAHLLRETMNSLEAKLNPKRFVRIHRSTLVNIERIKELQPLFHGDYSVALHDGTHLTLSRGYRERLQQLLGNSAF